MDIKQIFTLHADGLSNRRIADILGLSRNTINQYISLLKTSDYTAKEFVGMENATVRELFPSHTHWSVASRSDHSPPWLVYSHANNPPTGLSVPTGL